MYGNYERHITRAAHIERVQNRVSECEREKGVASVEMNIFMWARVDSRVCFFFFFLLSLMLVHEIYEEEKFELFAMRKFFIFSRFDLTFLKDEGNPGNFYIFCDITEHFRIFSITKFTQVICNFAFFQPSDFSSPNVAIFVVFF